MSIRRGVGLVYNKVHNECEKCEAQTGITSVHIRSLTFFSFFMVGCCFGGKRLEQSKIPFEFQFIPNPCI